MAVATALTAVGCAACAPAAQAAPTLYLANPNGSVIQTNLAGNDDPADRPLVGDWDGDGDDNVGLYSSAGGGPAVYRLGRNNTASSNLVENGKGGSPGDYLVAGRWYAGATKDSIAIWRDKGTPNWKLYTPTSASSGLGTGVLIGGNWHEDQPVFGDWNGDGIDTIGLWRDGVNHERDLYISNSNTNISYTLANDGAGNPGDMPVIADWDGNGTDTLGLFRPSEGRWFVPNSAGHYDGGVLFGDGALDIPIAGDWDGNGTETIGLYRPGVRYFFPSPSNTQPDANAQFQLTALKVEDSDKLLYADWDGDGKDTPGAFRPSTGTVYYGNDAKDPTHNVLLGGLTAEPDVVAGRWNSGLDRDSLATWSQSQWKFWFPASGHGDLRSVPIGGNPTDDTPVFGDWNGDGVDTIGLWRRTTRSFYPSNSNTNVDYPTTPTIIGAGNPGDLPVVGDWDHDGKDTIALFRPMPYSGQEFYGANPTNDFAIKTSFGDPGDKPAVGDWDGDGYDNVGVSRLPASPPAPTPPPPAPPADVPVAMFEGGASCQNAGIRSDSFYGISLGPDAKKIVDKYKARFDKVVDCMRTAMGGRAPMLRFQLPIDAFRRDSTGYKAPSAGYEGVAGGTQQLAAFKTLLAKTGGVGIISIMGSWFEECSGGTVARASTWTGPLGTCGYPHQKLYRKLFQDEIKPKVDQAGFVASGIFYTAWNEPDQSMFTLKWAAGSEELGARWAGRYWAHAAQIAGPGQVLAGEFAGSAASRVNSFMAGVSEATDLVGARPAPQSGRWALHTYDPFPSSRINNWEGVVPNPPSSGTLGTAWMTEIGQYRSDAGSPQGSWQYGNDLRYRAIGRASKLVMYHLIPSDNPQDGFDSALLDVSGRARPVLCGLAALAKESCAGSV